MDELRVALEVLERREPRLVVARAVEGEPVARSGALVPRRAELRPGPEEREVDVEEDRAQHRRGYGADALATRA